MLSKIEIDRRFEILDQLEYLGKTKPVNLKMPLVSVWVITYQHENFINECLEGILMQKTNFEFEIVIGEDESSDKTREICKEYADKYPDRIRLFLRDRKLTALYDSKGIFYKSLNGTFTIRSCRGKYIALCEGDDYWTDPLKLQKQVDVLEANSHLVGCFHNSEERYWNDYSKSSSLYLSFPRGREFSIQELTQYNMVPTASIVFKNPIPDELFSKDFLNLPIGDWPLHLLNTRNGNYYYLPQVMSVRNLNPNSVWGMQDHKKNVAQVIYVYNMLIDSGWFNKGVVDLLKIGCQSLENSVIPNKPIVTISLKRRIINKIICILNKIK